MIRQFAPYLFVFLFSLAALAGPTGPALAKAELPEFYAAMVTTIGEEAAHKYFDGWTSAEVTFFRAKARGLLEATDPTIKTLPSTDHLFAKYSSPVFGTVGELYANVHARAGVPTGAVFMDEIDYLRLNNRGKKPDGLVYEVRDGTLTILSIVESKMGQEGFVPSQMNGVLDQWRRNGITVPVDGKDIAFPPGKITIQIGAGTQAQVKPLASTSNSECFTSVMLVASRPHDAFPGKTFMVPMAASQIRQALYLYMESIRAGRPNSPTRENSRVPVLADPELSVEFSTELRDWVTENLGFPKASGKTALERYLARQTSRRGSQGKVFLNDLDDATRDYLATAAQTARLNGTDSRALPAPSPFEQLLFTSDPADPKVRSALQAYYKGYVLTPEMTDRQIMDHPFSQRLARNPVWNRYTRRNPLPNLVRGTIPNTWRNCWGLLARMGHFFFGQKQKP